MVSGTFCLFHDPVMQFFDTVQIELPRISTVPADAYTVAFSVSWISTVLTLLELRVQFPYIGFLPYRQAYLYGGILGSPDSYRTDRLIYTVVFSVSGFLPYRQAILYPIM